MLAIVNGIQRFHTYLYGRQFKIITDHRPLITICRKPLNAAPARLQRMFLQIQGYDFSIEYRRGEEMTVADALSRSPNPQQKEEVELDLRVDGIEYEADEPDNNCIALINFSAEQQNQLRQETENDSILNALKEVIYTGWPDNISELPTNLRNFWSYRDELAVEAGVIFKGRQVLIPPKLRKGILHKLHTSHQGIEKTRLLARESVYWPNINKDVETLCKTCLICQEFMDTGINKKEPFIVHKPPSRAWQYIASDLFEIGERKFLLTVDRYSSFPLVQEFPSMPSSSQVANTIKGYCALFGKPDEIMTDNGPQYTGEAFRRFTTQWEIKHVTSSPHYPQSNGFIERHVKHIKSLFKKAIKAKEDLHKVMMYVRATPVDGKLKSPAELLYGRTITTLLPSRTEPGPEDERRNQVRRQENVLARSPSTPELPPLYPGQNI